jgi:C1A family cysteine protease
MIIVFSFALLTALFSVCKNHSTTGVIMEEMPQEVTHRSAADLFPMAVSCPIHGERLYPKPSEIKTMNAFLPEDAVSTLPDSFSWLDQGMMTAVKDQQLEKCGSCWAFAAVGAFESWIKRSDGFEVDLSEQQLVNCVFDYGGCNGGNGFYAHLYMVDNGIVREEFCPYVASDGPCNIQEPSEFYLTEAWNYFISDTETQLQRRQNIKHLMMTYGALDAVMAVHTDFFDHYHSGIYTWDGHSPHRFYHGVVIVGWKDDGSLPNGGYWIVKNCWGESWGENGYFRVEYDSPGVHIIEFDIRYGLYNGQGDDPPYFDGLEDNYSGLEGTRLIISEYAVDPDGGSLSFEVNDAPRGLSIDPSSGEISWTPDHTQAGNHQAVISINDGSYEIHKRISFEITNVKKIRH